MKRVVCFGIAVLDRVYTIDALPHGGGKLTAQSYRESGGGIAATAAVAIAALGGTAAFAGAIGDDPAAAFLLAEMAALGVDLRVAQRIAGARTPTCCALVDAQGERCLIVDRGTARPTSPPLDHADALLIDHRFPAEALTLLDRAPPGTPIIFDAEGGTPADLQALAARVDYPIFSRPGLLACTGADDPAHALARVAAPRARAIGVTLGEDGSLWRYAGELLHFPAPRMLARDTTGAGDVFHGAFALAIAEGQSLQASIAFASAAAALKVHNGNGWRGMPSRADVQALLA